MASVPSAVSAAWLSLGREVCKLAEGAVDSVSCVADEDVEEQWPRAGPCGTLLVSGLRLGVEPLTAAPGRDHGAHSSSSE